MFEAHCESSTMDRGAPWQMFTRSVHISGQVTATIALQKMVLDKAYSQMSAVGIDADTNAQVTTPTKTDNTKH
jgi:hypothetical protein